MEGCKISLHLSLLLTGLTWRCCGAQSSADQVTHQPAFNFTALGQENDTNQSDTLTTLTNPTNSTASSTGCLIDPQLGLIVAASTSGVVLCLLVSTLVLACMVCRLRRRGRTPRLARSHVDLVSGTGYWGSENPEEGGLVGPCDASVMMEEVRADGGMEEEEEEEECDREEREEEAAAEEGAKNKAMDSGNGEMATQMQSSSSRDSCLEVPEDLENMPLMV